MFLYSTVFVIFRIYNKLVSLFLNTQYLYLNKFLTNTTFLKKYLYLNDITWQEGFLIDFVQKKSVDKFMRKFLIYSMYLFNERMLFDKIIRIYSDVILFISANKMISDFNNVASVLLVLLSTIGLLISTWILGFILTTKLIILIN